MTVKIRVRDYQSIEDAEIEVSGLTVITGANNTGKSAMLRAVYGAFTNARGTKYVRHGKDQCAVTVTFGDGRTVTWEKGEKVNRYTVDGKVLDKVGAGVPVEVEALGVVPITAAGRELWPQFAQQFTGQVFLLDQPGSVLAESIADVSRVGVLNEALRNTQSDKRSLSSELKVRLGDVSRYEAQEAFFTGLDAVEALAQEAEDLKSFCDDLSSERSDLGLLRDALSSYESLVLGLLPVRNLALPGDGSEVREGLTELASLRELSEELSGAVAAREALSPVSSLIIPSEADTARAAKVLEALSLVRGMRDQMTPLLGILGDSEGIRASASSSLPEAVDLLEQAKQAEAYRQIQKELSSRDTALADLRRELGETSGALDLASHEVQEIIGDAGSCPICGHP